MSAFLFHSRFLILLACLFPITGLMKGADLSVPYSAPLLADGVTGDNRTDSSGKSLVICNDEAGQGKQSAWFFFDLATFSGQHTPAAFFKFYTAEIKKEASTPVVQIYGLKVPAAGSGEIPDAAANAPEPGEYIASFVGGPSKAGYFAIDITGYINSQLANGNRRIGLLARLGGKPGACPPVSILGKKSSNPPQLVLQPGNAPAYSEEECLRPFWTGESIHEEPVLALAKDGSRPAGRLLFEPEKILSVRVYPTGRELTEGKDWVLEGDRLVLPEGSAAPSVAFEYVYPDKPRPAGRFFDKTGGGKIFSPEGLWFAQHCIWVTYKKKASAKWNGPVPRFAGQSLQGTLKKLEGKSPLTVVLIGDSISMGANSSRSQEQSPLMPSWGALVASSLHTRYGGPVIFKNHALGGMAVTWGAANAENLVAAEKPDLCIIAFGMNDRGGVTPDQFLSQVRQIMESAKKANPACEFILVSSMLCNELWASPQPLYDFRTKLFSLQGPGVAVADVTALHAELLKTKTYLDLTGNNVNHPNDFLIRCYAQAINALLIP